MVPELENRLSVASTNTFWSTTMLKSWLNRSNIWACAFKKWPFTEKKDDTETTVASQDNYDYPTDFKSDSIRILRVDGKRYTKIRYEDYLKYREDDPDGDDKVFSDYKREYFINPNCFSGGETIEVYGQATPDSLELSETGVATATTALRLIDATKNQFAAGDVGKTVWNKTDDTFAIVTGYNNGSSLTIDTDIMAKAEDYELYSETNKTPFADAEEEGNEAIIKKALSIALKKGKKFNEAKLEETEAREILNEIYTRIQGEQSNYHTKKRSLFKKINIIKGTTS